MLQGLKKIRKHEKVPFIEQCEFPLDLVNWSEKREKRPFLTQCFYWNLYMTQSKAKKNSTNILIFRLFSILPMLKQHKDVAEACLSLLYVAVRHRHIPLWGLGAQGHLTCVHLLTEPLCSFDGQIAADLESLVRLLDRPAGSDPAAHWTSVPQPGNICQTLWGAGQNSETDQSGRAGLELIGGRREDWEDRRREAGACGTSELTDKNMNSVPTINETENFGRNNR